VWKANDIKPDSFLLPYKPQISFTATGFEVTSRAAAWRVNRILYILQNDLYHGSSIFSANKFFR